MRRLDEVPTVLVNKETAERKPIPVSFSDMPESIQTEWLGRAALLRLDIGDTKALDDNGRSQSCQVKRYFDNWIAQMEAAKKAKELLAADGCTAECVASKAEDRRKRINAIIDERSYICRKGKDKGKRKPKAGFTRAKLRAEIKAWNARTVASRSSGSRRKSDDISTHGSPLELIRRLAAAKVDARLAEAQRIARTPRGELRGAGRGETLPCDIRPDLPAEERHQQLVECAEKDATHLKTWVEDLHEGRSREEQDEWDSAADDSESEEEEACPEPVGDDNEEVDNEEVGGGPSWDNFARHIFARPPLHGF